MYYTGETTWSQEDTTNTHLMGKRQNRASFWVNIRSLLSSCKGQLATVSVPSGSTAVLWGQQRVHARQRMCLALKAATDT